MAEISKFHLRELLGLGAPNIYRLSFQLALFNLRNSIQKRAPRKHLPKWSLTLVPVGVLLKGGLSGDFLEAFY